jgi:glutathione S-transferase
MTLRLYRHPLSGHCHRVELFLSLLGLKFERVDVDLFKGAHKAPEFLAKNPFGQLPVLDDGDVTIADSNAILVYLATRYDAAGGWLPRDPVGAAQVQRWLSIAAGPLAYGPSAARLVKLFNLPHDHARACATASQLFDVMEPHLARQAFLAGKSPTIADIALYAYTALAPEGGIALLPYPAISAWLARIEALPGFVAMTRTAQAA